MSLKLPASSSPLRELFDIADLAALADIQARTKLPTLQQAKMTARNVFATDNAVKQVNMLVIRANGELHLMKFGPKGGTKKLWNFGVL